ncbi:hypothetical protein OM427_19725 [Halomonas sp. 18H]|uniref:hypothetical protein n=1 Tax=Halomonas almeriensis TaxID=308163 RepID=UPI002230327C|nr:MULTISPECIES: hypothetical protein [Halomonas]MCW4151750.1 hypothetical protein [Halomonas sp. 18H]MDN3553996.1 hypothetical protein [Halomonas almeriensis]
MPYCSPLCCRRRRTGKACLLFVTLGGASEASGNPLAPIQKTPDIGGQGSVEQFDHNAYSLPLYNMSMTQRLDFSVGNSFFHNPWVEAPASIEARDVLGLLEPLPAVTLEATADPHDEDGDGISGRVNRV